MQHREAPWEAVPLEKLGFLGRGKSRHRPRNDPKLYGGPYPFVQTGDVTRAEFRLFDYSQTYSAVGLAQSKLWPAGTLCITIAANIAETAILGIDACFPDSVVGFIGDDKKTNTAFIKYSIDLMKHRYQAISRGTTQDNLSVEKLNSIEILVPKLVVQTRIADILSAYDDLIEVNQRRIAILEEMARRLFDEWFVQFRYPGHEAGELIETEFGPAPEAWKHGRLADISQFISRGIAPAYDDRASGTVINQKCIRDRCLSLEQARRQSKFVPQEKLLQYGDVLINSTGVGTLGRVAQVMVALDATTVDSHVTIVRAAKNVDLQFFGLQSLRLEPTFERQGVGSTGQTELSRKAIADTELLVPPNRVMKDFGRIVAPLRAQAELMRQQNTRPRAARDLLLPKLISGEIDVGRAEAARPEAAE